MTNLVKIATIFFDARQAGEDELHCLIQVKQEDLERVKPFVPEHVNDGSNGREGKQSDTLLELTKKFPDTFFDEDGECWDDLIVNW